MNETKNHILWVTTWYPNEFHATLGNFVQRHAKAASLRDSITLIAPLPSDGWRIDVDKADGVHEIRSYYPRYLRFIGALIAYKRALKNVTVPIYAVHGHALIGCWWMLLHACLVMKKPILLTEHWAGFHHRDERRIPFLKRMMMKLVGSKLTQTLPVTTHLGQAMQRLGYIQSFDVIPNVVDTTLFKPKQDSTNPEFCRFIHVSTLDDAQKNIRGLLNACAELRKHTESFHLEIIGDGAITPWINMAKQLDLYPNHVTIEGEKPLFEIANRMRNADALVLFSRYENFPCVIAEAWSCGIPMISSDVGGIKEYQNAFNGVLVASEDGASLVRALKAMIHSHGNYDRTIIRDFAVKHFSEESIGKRFHEEYSK